MQEFMFENDNSFHVNQCGQVTTISKQALLLTPFYYFPLAVFFVLIIAKVVLKSNVVHKIRLVVNPYIHTVDTWLL